MLSLSLDSTDSLRKLDGRHSIGFNTSFLLLNTGIGTTGDWIVTSISVTGNLTPDASHQTILFGIQTER